MTPRWSSASLAFAVLCPLACFAAPLEIPELGVQIANLPSEGIKPQVIRRVDGYQAILPLGGAKLTIARLDDPVPPGSSVGDAVYRAVQEADFHEDLGPHVYERASVVGGHDAWTRVSAQRWSSVIPPGGADNGVRYLGVTYVIVDRHLYRLVVYANGGVTTPPDFDAAAHALSGLTFVPVDRSADAAPAPSGLLKMPKWQVAMSMDWYPPAAVRRGEEGVVDLQYSIDGKGHIRDASQTFAVSDTLGKGASAMLQSSTYRVSPSWEANGYQTLRFVLEVQFWLNHAGSGCPKSVPPRAAAAETVVICSSMVR